MTLKQLSGVDASFLYMETASSFGHVSSVSFYERPFPEFDAYQAMRDQLERRLPLLEPYRRRVVTVPFDLDHPYWIKRPGVRPRLPPPPHRAAAARRAGGAR
ncbi:MAG: wax ester/triacylglycerol synthase family O-acyltransferase [Actinomycetota bacterium]|nr:wax ester/triacylglycerol synthase family O-acyltransferase [Actinomycetota bacterium]